MKVEQRLYQFWEWTSKEVNKEAQLVLVFISSELLEEKVLYDDIQSF